MDQSTKILLLNAIRFGSLPAMIFGVLIFALFLTMRGSGAYAVGTIIAVIVVFFARLYSVRELDRLKNEAPQETKEATKLGLQTYKYIWVASSLGSVIGFLLRPSAPLVGQLPLSIVITRGAELRGLDQLLVPAAQTSFNYVLVGGLIGTAVGFIAPKFMTKK